MFYYINTILEKPKVLSAKMEISLNLNKSVLYGMQYPTSFKRMVKKSFADDKKHIPSSNRTDFSKILDKNSDASRFFGVTSRDAVNDRLYAQARLSRLKCKEQNIMETLIKNQFNIDDINDLLSARNSLWETDKINKLWDKGASRFTFAGNFFGKDAYGRDEVHTIGLVVDKNTKTLFVLDSLPASDPSVLAYREKLKSFLFTPNKDEQLKFDKIIFSTKYQQSNNEYTCNNWTHANIEALQKELKTGRKISTSEELNEILPDNINTILEEQKNYLLKNISPQEMKFLNY